MKIEDVIDYLGFGRFQKRLIVLGSAAAACTSIQGLIIVFITFTPDFRCAVPGLDNDTFHPRSEVHKDLINRTIPDGEDGHCHHLQLNESVVNGTTDKEYSWHSPKLPLKKCSSWVYDQSVFAPTVVTEYNLVCERSIQTAHGQMAYMAGLLTGSFSFGILGDKFGRKKAALICMFLSVPASIYMRWTPNWTTFMVLRFLIGACVIGAYANIFVIQLEFMKRSKRVVVSFITDMGGILGVIVMEGVAYFVRDWRLLHLAVFMPCLSLVTYIWLLPESLRWSLKNGKVKEAKSLLLKIAKENRVELPEKFTNAEIDEEKRESFMKIFTTPILRKRFIILAINWIGIVMVYYGLTLNSENLGGNLYVNILTSFAMEIPALILVRILVNRIGRKLLYILFALICGISCISTLFPLIFDKSGLQWLILTLTAIGKLCATGGFQVIYIYTSELFPTTLRMSALGSLSGISRIGGICAPYIVELTKQIRGDIGVAVPLLVFGGDAIVSALLCVMLPETRYARLPETSDDVQHSSWSLQRDQQIHQSESIAMKLTQSRTEQKSGIEPVLTENENSVE